MTLHHDPLALSPRRIIAPGDKIKVPHRGVCVYFAWSEGHDGQSVVHYRTGKGMVGASYSTAVHALPHSKNATKPGTGGPA